MTETAADSRGGNGPVTRPVLAVASLRLRLDGATLPSRKRLTVDKATNNAGPGHFCLASRRQSSAERLRVFFGPSDE